MKRTAFGLSVLLLVCLLLPTFAFAEALPLSTPPSALSYSVDSTGTDDVLYVWFAVPEDIRALFPASDEKSVTALAYEGSLDSFGLQIDFSPDGSGWRYTADWDSKWNVGAYNDLPRSAAIRGEDILSVKLYDLSDDHTFDALSDAAPGLVSETDGSRRFDFGSADLFLRCRYFAALKQDGETYFSHSGWSETLDAASTASVALPERIEPPVVSALSVAADGSLTFTLAASETAVQANAHYTFMRDGSLDDLVAEYRVNGGDWLPASVTDASQPLMDGQRSTASGLDIPADAFVEFRVCYGYTGPNGYATAGWSQTAACGVQPTEPTAPSASSCPLCGQCSAPLGVCLWVWIGGGGLLVVLLVVLLAIVTRKQRCPSCGERCSRKAEYCPNCHLRLAPLNAPSAPDDRSTEDEPAQNPTLSRVPPSGSKPSAMPENVHQSPSDSEK